MAGPSTLKIRTRRATIGLARWVEARPRWAVVGGIGCLLLVGLMLAVWVGPRLVDRARDVRADGQLARHESLIARHAERTGLPVELIRTVVRAESSGRAGATSNRGAKGLMQITPITEKDVRQRNPRLPAGDLFDPDYNLRIGTTYLAYLLKRFDGDLTLALMAYHMGPTAVRRGQAEHPRASSAQLLERHGGPQTRAYVRKVLREYRGG